MKYRIQFDYKGPKTSTASMQSDWIEARYVDVLLDDMQKTGRVHNLMIMDEMGSSWTRKEYAKLKETVEEEPHDITVYFDGGFDIQTGMAGAGTAVYYWKENRQYRFRLNSRLGELVSNNEAEYAAFYQSLSLLEEIGVRHMPCLFRGDAQGVLKQLSGEWPCYEESLNRWLDRIEAKLKQLNIKPEYEAINRKDNKEADKLATQALSGQLVRSHTEITERN